MLAIRKNKKYIVILSILMTYTSCQEKGVEDLGISILSPDSKKAFLDSVTKSLIISDTIYEKLAHGSHIYGDVYSNDGTMWSAYYTDENQSTEHPLVPTIFPKLTKFNVKRPEDKQHFTIAKANMRIGNHVIGNRPPYDPNMIIELDSIKVLFRANINAQSSMVYRGFSKKNLTFENDLHFLKIRYRVNGEVKTQLMNAEGIIICSNDLGFNTNGDLCFPILSRIIKYNNRYYTTLSSYGLLVNPNIYPGHFNSAILSSIDGIIWDVVTIQPKDLGVVESQIAIKENIIYYIARSDSHWYSYIGKYNMTTNQWSKLEMIDNSIPARPELFFFKDTLYAMYNIYSLLETPQGKLYRSTVTLQQVNLNTLQLNEFFTVQYPYGISYFAINEHNNKLYMSFTEDRRKIQLHGSDIAFCEISL